MSDKEGEAALAAPDQETACAEAPLAGEIEGYVNGSDSGSEKRSKSLKVRRVDELAFTEGWTEQLRSKDEAYHVHATFSMSTTHECGIMQELTHLVELENMPQLWPRENWSAPGGVSNIHDQPKVQVASANTVHLPCGHVFHACSLALHFLVQDMRCPICRVGHETCMSLDCIPLSIRNSYSSKLKTIEALHTSEEEIDPVEIMNILTQNELAGASAVSASAVVCNQTSFDRGFTHRVLDP